ATPNHPSAREVIRGKAATIVVPQVPAVDVADAVWRNGDSCRGVADRSAQAEGPSARRPDTPTHPVVSSGVATPRGATREESRPPGPASSAVKQGHRPVFPTATMAAQWPPLSRALTVRLSPSPRERLPRTGRTYHYLAGASARPQSTRCWWSFTTC